MADFFHMGGYAGYVWPTYIISAVVLTALFVATWRGLKSRERLLETLKAARGGRRRRSPAVDADADTDAATPITTNREEMPQ